MVTQAFSFNKAFQYNQIGYITTISEPMHLTSKIEYIKNEFNSDPELPAIPIESGTGVCGIVERNSFYTSTRSKIDSFIHNSLEYYVLKDPVILDARTDCEKALQLVFATDQKNSIANVLVYNKGKFFGVLNMHILIKHILFLRKSELLKAKEIQELFIGKNFIETDTFWAGVSITMARELGGDFFQLKKIHDALYMIACFDVCGKDVSASLYTTIIGSFFSSLEECGLLAEKTPEELITLLNNVFRKNSTEGNFLSCIFFFVDLNAAQVKVFNMGFSPLNVLYKKPDDKVVLEIKNPQYPILGLHGEPISASEPLLIPFSNDLRLFSYSDGVTDVQNKFGDVYGEKNIKDFIIKNKDRKKEYFLQSLSQHIDDFMTDTPQADDITAVFIDFRQ